MEPTEGEIKPGATKTLKFTFSPKVEKQFQRTFVIKVPPDRKWNIIARGQGTSVNLTCSQDKVQIGPVLPYDDTIYLPVEITNPTEYDNVFYCHEIDKQYLDEEKQISQYEDLQGKECLYFPVREGPDYPFWEKIQIYTKYNTKKREIEKALESSKISLEKREELQAQLDVVTDEYEN